MLGSDVLQAHLVPRAVNDVLATAINAGCTQSIDVTFGWALHHQSLLLWKVEEGLHAAVRRLQLPQPVSDRAFVEVVAHASSTAVTVVVCTASGQLCVWLDANFISQPYTQQLFTASEDQDSQHDVIKALAACAADQGSTPGFLAVIGTADGALHMYHGSQQGIFPRQFYKPAKPTAGTGSFLTKSLNIAKSLYHDAFDPLYKVQRQAPSSLPAIRLQLLPVAAGRWRLLVMTPEALDCWLLGSGAGQYASEQLLWSYNLHGVLSSELHAQELQLIMFSCGSDGQQAVVWSCRPASSSVGNQHSFSALSLKADTIPFYDISQDVTSTGNLPDPSDTNNSSWQLISHLQHPSYLALAADGTVLEWVPARKLVERLAAASEDNLAIGCSPASRHWLLFNRTYGVLEIAGVEDQAAAAPSGASGQHQIAFAHHGWAEMTTIVLFIVLVCQVIHGRSQCTC